MRGSIKREVGARFCYFVKRICYRTSLTPKLPSKLNVPWRILMRFAYFLQDATRCVKAAVHTRRQLVANDVVATSRSDKSLREYWRTFVKIFVSQTTQFWIATPLLAARGSRLAVSFLLIDSDLILFA